MGSEICVRGRSSGSFGDLSGVQSEVTQVLSDVGPGNPQVAVAVGNTSGESDQNPTAEYHSANGGHGFGLFRFTDAPAQNVYNYAVFTNWCSVGNRGKNNTAVQAEYFTT